MLTKQQQAARSAYMKKRYADHKKRGLCVICDRKAKPGQVRCQRCRKRDILRHAAKRVGAAIGTHHKPAPGDLRASLTRKLNAYQRAVAVVEDALERLTVIEKVATYGQQE